MNSVVSQYRISALDTWFFRESRPMETIGGTELASVFPPPPRTLLGALRTAVGDATGIHWPTEFHPESDLARWIGHGDDLGPLMLEGVWLSLDGKPLYPAPPFLLYKEEKDGEKDRNIQHQRLVIGNSVRTHLGRVHLPALPKGMQGFKPYDNAWLTESGWKKLLLGQQLPLPDEVKQAKDLFREEPRLGIARDNGRRTAIDGALYQTRHLRPLAGLSLNIALRHAPGMPTPTPLARLGGEGRMAHIDVVADKVKLPGAPKPQGKAKGLILILASPARFVGDDGKPSWLPPGFARVPPEATTDDRPTIWRGKINGRINGQEVSVSLDIHAAALDKACREGGWDMANHRPRAVQSLIPAGGAYYATLTDPKALQLDQAIAALHTQRIGEDQELGRGLLACGIWPQKEFTA